MRMSHYADMAVVMPVAGTPPVGMPVFSQGFEPLSPPGR